MGRGRSADEQFDLMLSAEMTSQQMVALAPATVALQDDRPINEYFLLRASRAELTSIVKKRIDAR
jgi:hypothetical protein